MPIPPESEDWAQQIIEDGSPPRDQDRPPGVLQGELMGNARRHWIEVQNLAGEIFRASLTRVTRVLVVLDGQKSKVTYRVIRKAPSDVHQFPHAPLDEYKDSHLTEEDTSPSLDSVRSHGTSSPMQFDVDDLTRRRGGDPQATIVKSDKSFLFGKTPSKFKRKK